MYWLIWAVEIASVSTMLVRWGRKWLNGDYDSSSDEEVGKFFAALVVGAIPLFSVTFLIAEALHRRDLRAAEDTKRKELEEKRADKLLGL